MNLAFPRSAGVSSRPPTDAGETPTLRVWGDALESERPSQSRRLRRGTDHRAAVNLRRRHQRDLFRRRRGQDRVVRGELMDRGAGVEDDLHFLPERIEARTLART